ncbi:MAG: family 43 glycosylhydrolase [Nannocystaceae bacterium]
MTARPRLHVAPALALLVACSVRGPDEATGASATTTAEGSSTTTGTDGGASASSSGGASATTTGASGDTRGGSGDAMTTTGASGETEGTTTDEGTSTGEGESEGTGESTGGTVVQGESPVLPGDHADPGVLRVDDGQGGVVYHLTHTVHNGGDFPRFTSTDLVHWEPAAVGLFDRSSTLGSSIEINGHHYCSRWAPEVSALGPGSYILSFTAQSYAGPKSPCPAYAEDSGVYLAWSSSPAGPFALAEKPWEPLPAGGQISNCPPAIRDAIPHSLDFAGADCQGTYCHHIIRLDSTVWRDPKDGRWWLGYAWYTNTPPKVDWEKSHYGELVNLVELDAADPFAVICDPNVAQIGVADPHDGEVLGRLATACEGCDQMLSFTRGRQGEEMIRDGYSWGVVEGPSLFRRGEYVYLLLSGSAWDSAYYHVYWVAAKSVEGLALGAPDRLIGRFLIPSDGQAFGHGTPVLGPDGESWYYVHHRLDHAPCKGQGLCGRDVWVSPIDFIDRGDGLGAVHIAPRWPAKTPGFEVTLP